MFEKRDNSTYVTEHGVNECLEAIIDAAQYKKLKVSNIDNLNHVVEFKSAMSFFGMGDKVKVYIDENEEGLTTIMFREEGKVSHEADIISTVMLLLEDGKSGGAW